MTTKYYQNAHGYFVEVPLTYGGSLSVAPGKYVEGSADTGASFPRQASLGVLTDVGLTTDGDTGCAALLIAATPSLLIFSEPQPPLIGDTGVASTVKGDTGTTGAAGAAGGKGDTGTAGAKGDTGVAGT
jgi:hypothetical protein